MWKFVYKLVVKPLCLLLLNGLPDAKAKKANTNHIHNIFPFIYLYNTQTNKIIVLSLKSFE